MVMSICDMQVLTEGGADEGRRNGQDAECRNGRANAAVAVLGEYFEGVQQRSPSLGLRHALEHTIEDWTITGCA